MPYKSIVNGSPAPTPPTEIEVAIAKQTPIPHSEATLVKKGDPDYDDAVEWWMFVSGYVMSD